MIKPFYVVAYGISRHYGGPEEGGWWYDWHEVLEVHRVFDFQQGIRAAHKLKENHGAPKYNRFSAANRGEQDVVISVHRDSSEWDWIEEQRVPHYC